jgi:hypothetical protein
LKESEGQVPVHEDGHGVYWVGREAFSFFLNSLISFLNFLISFLISLFNPNEENKSGLVGTIFFLSEFFDLFP